METKNIILAVLGSVVAVFVVALIVFNINETKKSENDSPEGVSSYAPLHEQYPNLPEENRFVQESAGDIVDRFTTGTGVIFLGFKECPWCQKTAPLINQAAEAENETIYYVDIREERENMTAEYQDIVSILSPHLPKNEEGSVRISTPDISIVKDGEIIWRFKMESVSDAEKTPDTYWTGERQAQAIKQFKQKMQELR